MWKLYVIRFQVSINKPLEHSHRVWLTSWLWLLCSGSTVQKLWWKPWPANLKIRAVWPFIGAQGLKVKCSGGRISDSIQDVLGKWDEDLEGQWEQLLRDSDSAVVGALEFEQLWGCPGWWLGLAAKDLQLRCQSPCWWRGLDPQGPQCRWGGRRSEKQSLSMF